MDELEEMELIRDKASTEVTVWQMICRQQYRSCTRTCPQIKRLKRRTVSPLKEQPEEHISTRTKQEEDVSAEDTKQCTKRRI
ncbi:hypothetical protein SRHO_G00260090 [Serrasalmus rhombeus]